MIKELEHRASRSTYQWPRDAACVQLELANRLLLAVRPLDDFACSLLSNVLQNRPDLVRSRRRLLNIEVKLLMGEVVLSSGIGSLVDGRSGLGVGLRLLEEGEDTGGS